MHMFKIGNNYKFIKNQNFNKNLWKTQYQQQIDNFVGENGKIILYPAHRFPIIQNIPSLAIIFFIYLLYFFTFINIIIRDHHHLRSSYLKFIWKFVFVFSMPAVSWKSRMLARRRELVGWGLVCPIMGIWLV